MESILGQWGSVSSFQLTAVEGETFGPHVFEVQDYAGNPVNLEGKTVKLTLWKPGIPDAGLLTLSTSAGEIIVNGNVVIVQADPLTLPSKQLYNFQLDNVSDDQTLAVGTIVTKLGE